MKYEAEWVVGLLLVVAIALYFGYYWALSDLSTTCKDFGFVIFDSKIYSCLAPP